MTFPLNLKPAFPKLILPLDWGARVEQEEISKYQPRIVQTVISLLRRNWRTCAAGLAMIIDAGILAFTFAFVSYMHFPNRAIVEVFRSHLGVFALFLPVFLISFTALGLYRTVSYTPFTHHFLSATKAYIYSAAIILSTLFLVGDVAYPRRFLVLLFATLPGVYVIVWFGVRRLLRGLREFGYGKWSTLVVGPAKNIERLLERFQQFPDLGYDTVRILQTPVFGTADHKLHVQGLDLEREIINNKVEFMVLSSPELNGAYDELEHICKKHYVRMRVVSPETDRLFNHVHIHDIAGLPLFSPERKRIDGAKRAAKRVFDIVGAVILLTVLSPLFLIVAVATKLESKGPVLFKQQRALSDRDEPFKFYKFRSMYKEADEKKESLFIHNESNGALFKMKNDPRLTKVGKYIRRYSIDELPQLFNVLKGEMSLVGPRPLPVGDFKRVTEQDDVGGYFRARAKAKPGMTGLWQVSGRSHLGFREMVLLDLYYIENQSLLFDIEILAQTVPVVIFGKGAY